MRQLWRVKATHDVFVIASTAEEAENLLASNMDAFDGDFDTEPLVAKDAFKLHTDQLETVPFWEDRARTWIAESVPGDPTVRAILAGEVRLNATGDPYCDAPEDPKQSKMFAGLTGAARDVAEGAGLLPGLLADHGLGAAPVAEAAGDTDPSAPVEYIVRTLDDVPGLQECLSEARAEIVRLKADLDREKVHFQMVVDEANRMHAEHAKARKALHAVEGELRRSRAGEEIARRVLKVADAELAALRAELQKRL